jgi:hypothetical protein
VVVKVGVAGVPSGGCPLLGLREALGRLDGAECGDGNAGHDHGQGHDHEGGGPPDLPSLDTMREGADQDIQERPDRDSNAGPTAQEAFS